MSTNTFSTNTVHQTETQIAVTQWNTDTPDLHIKNFKDKIQLSMIWGYYNNQDENSIEGREKFINTVHENFLTTQNRIFSYARNPEISDEKFYEHKDNAVETFKNVLKKHLNTLNALQQSHITIEAFINNTISQLEELHNSPREKILTQYTK